MIQLLAETPRDQEIIDRLQRAIEELQKRYDELIRKFDEYRKRHPATVGVKNGRAYEILEESKGSHENGKRKPGAQPGHEGHSRKLPSITDRIEIHAEQFQCPECSSILVRKGIRFRTIEDIPIIEPKVIQYQIERMYCRSCRKVFEPGIPDTFPGAHLTIRTMLIAAYFKTAMRMSLESVSAAMKEIFSIRISEGEVQGILYQLSDRLGEEYNALLDQVREAPSRHMDTTTWRESGENMALWVFVTKGEAIFHIARSNNHEIAESMLREHSGTDIHDRHSAFETLASKTKNQQQYCWSHLICDARELESFYGEEGRSIKEVLQEIHEEAKSFRGRGTSEDVDALHEKLIFLIDRDYAHRRSQKFVDNLLRRRKEWLFRFVVDPDVESTNNRAERALRPSVIARKVSGGSRSQKGSKAYEVLESIRYTAKLRNKNFIKDVPGMLRKDPNPG
jgi:transposase